MNAFFEKDAGKDAGIDMNDFFVKSLPNDFTDIVARNFVFEVIRNVCLAEREIGHAQVLLCDDIDRTLTTIYQRQQDISSLSHWSARWASRLWDVENDYGDLFHVKRSSRSSSPDSFHSARRESRIILKRPVAFLGHAASYGLTSYVLNRFNLQKKHLDKEYATYLLCSFVWAVSHSHWGIHVPDSLPRQLDVVAELLRRGANLNIYIGDFSTTIWG